MNGFINKRGPLQNSFIKAFLSTEAIKSYESVEENIEDYAVRCRKAFEEPAKDFIAAIQYRKRLEFRNTISEEDKPIGGQHYAPRIDERKTGKFSTPEWH